MFNLFSSLGSIMFEDNSNVVSFSFMMKHALQNFKYKISNPIFLFIIISVGHTVPMLDDMGLAFKDMGISISELEEYVEYVASVPCDILVPKYPVERESHLNLLKPGSREVVTRPVHIHEHLPAMHPQLEGNHKYKCCN